MKQVGKKIELMGTRAQEFRDMTSQLMHEGWRAYLLKDMSQLEDKTAYLIRHNLEILYFEKTPIFFIRSKYRRDV